MKWAALRCECGGVEFSVVETYWKGWPWPSPHGVPMFLRPLRLLYGPEAISCVACGMRYNWKGTTQGGWVSR